ncbi:Cytochrome P450 [Penicillium alfredii]|uniref:Cytochrome P450 n=1 Tax=Penicillium alfredii TaxID=1506179 RepID=A0A9W9ENA1_9EURO|nr:Cytochrome P450 [Penicillium alfredii]KAJ5084819.1 Cytochrome P450 [Penicillium alfredii]
MLTLYAAALLFLGYIPTGLWIKYQEFMANRRESIHHLHKVYGPVVRLSPNEVSFASLEAIKETYASGGSGYGKTEYYDLFRQFKVNPGGLKSLNLEQDLEVMQELTYHQSPQKNLLGYYLPMLAPYFPQCLHPRSAPKANQYVLDMAAQTNLEGYTLMEKLQRKELSLARMPAAAECKDHMAAGIDTTGAGLCFLMRELSQPQNLVFQKRLQHELTSAPADCTSRQFAVPRCLDQGGAALRSAYTDVSYSCKT